MRYFIASIVIWIINAIFSRRGYDRIDDMIVQLVIPGLFISVITAMFVFVFLEKRIKNKYLLGFIIALIVFMAFKANESYHSRKFKERYQETEQLQELVSHINKSLPKRATSETILNKVNLHLDILTYEFVADKINSKHDEEKFIQDLDRSKYKLINVACSSPIARQLFQKRYTLRYEYHTNENKQIYSIKVNPKVCNN